MLGENHAPHKGHGLLPATGQDNGITGLVSVTGLVSDSVRRGLLGLVPFKVGLEDCEFFFDLSVFASALARQNPVGDLFGN